MSRDKILTDKWLLDGAHAINAKVLATLLGLVDQGVDRRAGWANGQPPDAVLTHVGDVDEGPDSGGVTPIRVNVGPDHPDTKGVRGGGGGHLPLDGAVALLSPDAVVVILGLKELTPSKVVTLDRPRLASEVLHTVSWGPGK